MVAARRGGERAKPAVMLVAGTKAAKLIARPRSLESVCSARPTGLWPLTRLTVAMCAAVPPWPYGVGP
eukprot:8483270-Pyramimonas_sp.AAC.1